MNILCNKFAGSVLTTIPYCRFAQAWRRNGSTRTMMGSLRRLGVHRRSWTRFSNCSFLQFVILNDVCTDPWLLVWPFQPCCAILWLIEGRLISADAGAPPGIYTSRSSLNIIHSWYQQVRSKVLLCSLSQHYIHYYIQIYIDTYRYIYSYMSIVWIICKGLRKDCRTGVGNWHQSQKKLCIDIMYNFMN